MLQFTVTSFALKLIGMAKLSCFAGLVLLRKNQEVTHFKRSLNQIVCRAGGSPNEGLGEKHRSRMDIKLNVYIRLNNVGKDFSVLQFV